MHQGAAQPVRTHRSSADCFAWCRNCKHHHGLIWITINVPGLRLKLQLLQHLPKTVSDALTSIGTLFQSAALCSLTLPGLTEPPASLSEFTFSIRDSAFSRTGLNLADYFNPKAEKQFREYIEKIDDIKEVDELKAHYNGNLVTLDVVVIIDGTMSVLESYRLGEKIESLMLKNFGIIDTDVSFIPDSASDENEHKNRIRRNRNRF